MKTAVKSTLRATCLAFRYYLFRFYFCKKMPQILSMVDTLELVANKRLSVSRFGDGEMIVMTGGSIGYCHENAILSKRLKEVLSEPLTNHIVCVPRMLISLKGLTKNAKAFWRELLGAEYPLWARYLHKSDIYGDSFISRFYIGFQKKALAEATVAAWRKIWNDKVCMIVEGVNTRIGMGNDLMSNAKSIKRILCPPTDAFDKYDEILNAVINAVREINEDFVVLVALGPAAKILSYDLSKAGIQAIDCGHLDIEYEWFRQGTHIRTNIQAKAVNEFQGGLDASSEVTEEYLKEIICSVE